MKRILILTLCFAFAGIGNILAQELELPLYSWEIGTEMSYIKYEEPGVMEEEGSMFGIVSSYVYRPKFMFKAEGKCSWGEVDYKNSGTMNGVDDFMFEVRGLGGYDFPIWEASVLTPYIGLGYRYLNDDLKGVTSTGALGYERESNYFYSPIGVEIITESEDGWSFGAKIEYDHFWHGIQNSHLSDVNLGFDDLQNDQEKGYGVRGAVKFQKETEDVKIIVEPFIKYWNIKKSEEEPITYSGAVFGYGYEPKNNSVEIGGKIAVEF